MEHLFLPFPEKVRRAVQVLNVFAVVVSIAVIIGTPGCRRGQQVNRHISGGDSIRIIEEIQLHRAEVDSAFRFEPESPFTKDTSAHYNGIKWFPPDVQYYFQSKLHRYEHPETVVIFGTKGEERRQLKYGYFILDFDSKEYRLNAYKPVGAEAQRSPMARDYLSVWFTDKTTGKETYNVGRYLDVGDEPPDPDHLYTLNLNNAYNPYCAYSEIYSCAVPRREDHLNFPVRAGEMKYHK